MTITFDEYDKMLEMFEEMHIPTLWPTMEQLEMFTKDPEKWIMFCCYLYEKGEAPANNQEKYNKKNLRKFIDKYLEIV